MNADTIKALNTAADLLKDAALCLSNGNPLVPKADAHADLLRQMAREARPQTLADMMAALKDAKDQKHDARQRMTRLLMPILRAASGDAHDQNPTVTDVSPPCEGQPHYGISVYYQPGRHEPWSNYFVLPASVIDAADPVEAAHAYKAEQDRREKEASVARKREQLAKLKAELGEGA